MRLLAALTAVATLSAVACSAASATPARADDDPFEAGRRAAQASRFTAVVQVRWTDAAGVHESRLVVTADHGRVTIAGPAGRQLVVDAGAEPLAPPAMSHKFAVETGESGTVAGRPAMLVVLRAGAPCVSAGGRPPP